MFKRRTGFKRRASSNAFLLKRPYMKRRRILGKRSRKFFKPTRMQLVSSAKLDKFVRSKVVVQKFNVFAERNLQDSTKSFTITLAELVKMTAFKAFASQFEEISLSSVSTVVTLVNAKMMSVIVDTKAVQNPQIFDADNVVLSTAKRTIATANPVKAKLLLKPMAVHKSERTSPWIRTRDLYLHGLDTETGSTLLPSTYALVMTPLSGSSYFSSASTFTIVGRNHIASGTGIKAVVADRAIGLVQDGLVLDQHLTDKELTNLKSMQLTNSGAGVFFS